MTTDPLGCTVDDNVRAMFDRPDQVSTGTKCVVDNQRNLVLMGDLKLDVSNKSIARIVSSTSIETHRCKLWQRGNIVFGVADALDVDGFGLLVDGSFVALQVIVLNELGGDTESLEVDLQ